MDCLEKDPDRRPSSVRVVARRLQTMSGLNTWTRDRADRWWETYRPDLASASLNDSEPTMKAKADAHV
jgi:hypothetical protein